jgi:hypothetical protein
MTPTECVQAQLDAYNARDIDRFCAEFSDDVRTYDLTTGATLLEGAAAFRQRYDELFRSNPGLHCTLVNRIVCGHIVIDEEHVRGVLPNDGIIHAVATYEVTGDRITRVWFVREQL